MRKFADADADSSIGLCGPCGRRRGRRGVSTANVWKTSAGPIQGGRLAYCSGARARDRARAFIRCLMWRHSRIAVLPCSSIGWLQCREWCPRQRSAVLSVVVCVMTGGCPCGSGFCALVTASIAESKLDRCCVHNVEACLMAMTGEGGHAVAE